MVFELFPGEAHELTVFGLAEYFFHFAAVFYEEAELVSKYFGYVLDGEFDFGVGGVLFLEEGEFFAGFFHVGSVFEHAFAVFFLEGSDFFLVGLAYVDFCKDFAHEFHSAFLHFFIFGGCSFLFFFGLGFGGVG